MAEYGNFSAVPLIKLRKFAVNYLYLKSTHQTSTWLKLSACYIFAYVFFIIVPMLQIIFNTINAIKLSKINNIFYIHKIYTNI